MMGTGTFTFAPMSRAPIDRPWLLASIGAAAIIFGAWGWTILAGMLDKKPGPTPEQIRERQARDRELNLAEQERQKLNAEGWFPVQDGILARWCTKTCRGSETYMDYAWRLEVWCKERACGDIYARVNIQDGNKGPVVDWTNKTGYGDIGQRVVLTFQSATSGDAYLTEFRAE